jgi:hypothetical protein
VFHISAANVFLFFGRRLNPNFSLHFVLLPLLVTLKSGNSVSATASIDSTPTATTRPAPLDALSASFPFSCVGISHF